MPRMSAVAAIPPDHDDAHDKPTLVEAIPGLDATRYQPHRLHGEDAIWVEKNCYGDLWIELLHALGHEPMAMLPFTLAVDFEGDQWTFFKPVLDELRALYGVDVQEMTVWRPLLEHAREHLPAGKIICTEADSWWLPDTEATDYRRQHTKTTIALVRVDLAGERLGYFHNTGYFELSGEDFCGLFRLDAPPDAAFLPLFAELVRTDRMVRPDPQELATASLALVRKHYARRPRSNPFERFGERLERDLPGLRERGLAHYHAWAFASIRQAGSAFDLASQNLRWLAGFGHEALLPAAEAFDAVAQGNKALILKGARAVNSGRALDAGPLVADLAQAWSSGMSALEAALEKRMTTALGSRPDLDSINRSTWSLPSTVRQYVKLEGWIDPGEKASIEHVAQRVRGQPILDMGVGAGRTTALLKPLSDDYVGIDYTREMVDAARARHPGTRFEHMDARDLGAFADGQFAMVMFSFNGIDAVDVEDRHKVLDEVHRVLRPSGLFVLSAHNRLGPGHGEQPSMHVDFSFNPLRLAWRTVKMARSLPMALRNSRRLRAMNETHEDWSILNAGAHNFGIVVVYTTLAEQKRQLRAAGFEVEDVWDNVAGMPVADDADTSGMWWFNFVARKVGD